MNDSAFGQTSRAQTAEAGRSDENKGKALSFPTVALMFAAVFFVVLMLSLMGWKIVNLDNERALINTERRLLERDRLAYTKIVEELPNLEDRRQGLIREVSKLDGEVQSARAALDSLATQRNAARSELDEAKALRAEAQEATKVARDSLATIQAELQVKRPELQSLLDKVAALTEEEKALRLSRDQLQQETSKLQAQVAGLEQQKQNKKQVLEQMTSDTGALQSLSARFVTIANSLEASNKNVDKTLDGWKTQTQFIIETMGPVREKAQDFAKLVQGISVETGNLASAVKGIQTSIETAQQAAGRLDMSGNALGGAISQIQKAATSADKETQRLSQTFDGSTSSIQSGISTLNNCLSDLSKGVIVLDGHIGLLQSKIANIDGSTTKFSQTSAEVRRTADEISKTRTDLANELVAIRELITELKTAVQSLKVVEQRVPQEPGPDKAQ